jgi:hypothetical protein
MDIIEEEKNKIKNGSNNSIINSDANKINIDFTNIDLLTTEQTPSHNNSLSTKNINYNKIIVDDCPIPKKFKPYLSSKDEYKYDENLILENKIKELHKHKTNYLNYQPDLSVKKRFILLDWIMEVSSQFHFKRKTYYFCINLIELYFSKCVVNTNQIQLIGVACLLIAAKNEEITIPNLSYFTKACDDLYSKTQILNQEYIILKTLNWKIQYTNLSDLGNLLTFNWDNIIKNLNKNFNTQDKFPFFRNDPEYQNLLLEHFFQILDYISLDYFFNFIHEKYICVCVMYIVIGEAKKAFTFNDSFQFFNNINPQNCEKIRNYQHFFFNFSKQYFKISMVEILDVLKYVCLFSAIQFEPHIDIKDNNISNEERNQFQRYNKNNSINFKKLKEVREASNSKI